MNRIILSIMMLVTASIMFTSCEAPAGNNAAANNANKPANAANTAAAPVPDKAVVEAEVKKAMDDFLAALNKNDAAALDKMYMDDYTLVDQNGAVQTKASRLETIKSGKIKFEGMAISDVKIKTAPNGNGSVVVGRVSGKNIVDGKTEERNSMVTWVLGRSKDNVWQFVSAQITDIKGGAAPAKADEKKADEKKPDAAANTAKPAAPANK